MTALSKPIGKGDPVMAATARPEAFAPINDRSTFEPPLDEIVRGLDRFIESVVIPLEREHESLLHDRRQMYDTRGAYAPEVVHIIRRVISASAEAGYYAMFCPIDIGGGGLDKRTMLEVYHHLYTIYGAGRLLPPFTISHWAFGPSEICQYFSPELKDNLLAEILAGHAVTCFGMSEPDAGSDAWMLSTRATPKGDHWVISGTKQWTSNSPFADYCYVFALTDPDMARQKKGGITCFLVPMDAPGVSIDSIIRFFGDLGGNEGILRLSEVQVPQSHIVGQLNRGFDIAMLGVNSGRVYNSARATGISEWSLKIALEYACSRRSFGKEIIQHQGVGFKLAECAMDLYAARSASRDLAARLDAGLPSIRELAMSKAICAESALRITNQCMQVCGAMGFTNELGLYAAWHSAKALQIADGSAEILRQTILKRLMRGELTF